MGICVVNKEGKGVNIKFIKFNINIVQESF